MTRPLSESIRADFPSNGRNAADPLSGPGSGDRLHWVDVLKLAPLMALSHGRREVTVALLDGPVDVSHPGLATGRIVEIASRPPGTCAGSGDSACTHGTLVAGILIASRDSSVPGICPGCTLLVRPVFPASVTGGTPWPAAAPEALAAAIAEAIDAGARLINLSLALVRPSPRAERTIAAALDYAVKRGALVIAAAGNQGIPGNSVITRHQGVIPVTACDARGQPLSRSTLGPSIGRHGLAAPGDRVVSLAAGGGTLLASGTSVAAPLVTGTMALLWSEFPATPAARLKYAVTRSYGPARRAVTPPLLDASAAHRFMATTAAGRR